MGKKGKAKEKARREAAELATSAVAGPSRATRIPTTDVEGVATRLNSVAVHLLRRLSREDAVLGLTAARLSALSVLVGGGPLTLGGLAKTERVTAPSMTRLITAMETDGLVERVPSAQDGRKVYVQATPAGAKVMRQGQDRRITALRAWLGPIGADGLQTLDEATVLLGSVLRDEPT